MAAVDIHLGKDSYTVEIRRGLLEDTGRKIRRLTDAEKIAVVTDDHVGPLYGDRFRKILDLPFGLSPYRQEKRARIFLYLEMCSMLWPILK